LQTSCLHVDSRRVHRGHSRISEVHQFSRDVVSEIVSTFGEIVLKHVPTAEHFLKHGRGEMIFERNYPHDQSSRPPWRRWITRQALNQNVLRAASVKFVIENLLPRSEIKLARRDHHNHLAARHLKLVMRIAVIFNCSLEPLGTGIIRREATKVQTNGNVPAACQRTFLSQGKAMASLKGTSFHDGLELGWHGDLENLKIV
jgi:hypothetical protein